MTSTMWAGVVLVILLLAAIAWMFFGRKKKHEVDYYALFILGIIWLPIGALIENYTFVAIGAVLTLVGILNKSRWRTNRKYVNKMGDRERLVITIVTGLLVLGVLASIIVLIFNKYY